MILRGRGGKSGFALLYPTYKLHYSFREEKVTSQLSHARSFSFRENISKFTE